MLNTFKAINKTNTAVFLPIFTRKIQAFSKDIITAYFYKRHALL